MTDRNHSCVRETHFELLRVYGVDRGTRIWDSLNSANDRLLFARRHFQLLRKETRVAIKLDLDRSNTLESSNCEIDIEAEFSQSMHNIKMHVTDCIQHLHTIGDTLAFAIYFFIDKPDNKRFEKKDITLYRVRRWLEESSGLTSAHTFSALLRKLADNENYTYLVDLNNHAKHRSIVKPAVNRSEHEEISQEKLKDLLVFSQMEMSNPPSHLQNRRGTPVHSQRSILPFIESELVRILNIYGEIREEIERLVQLAPSRPAYMAAHEV